MSTTGPDATCRRLRAARQMLEGSDKGYIRRHLSPSNPSFSFHSLQSSRPLESSQPLDLIMPSQVAQTQVDRAHYVRDHGHTACPDCITCKSLGRDCIILPSSDASLDHASVVCNTTAIVALDKAILSLESTLKDIRATRSILLEPLSKLNNSDDHSNSSDSDASSVFNLGGPLARSA